MKTADIQQALKNQGFDPGAIDGAWGRNTIAAVKAFQAAEHLQVDGIIGPQTLGALFGAAAPAPATDTSGLVWYKEALRLMGTREGPGNANNQVILDWAADLDIAYPEDSIAWCGLFVAHCVGSTLPDEVLPSNPLGARDWAAFGKACNPVMGSILVFWRKSLQSGLGHVGFYYGEDATTYYVLGGNQSDKVCVARVSKDRFLKARQPATVGALPPITVQRTSNELVSTNEA